MTLDELADLIRANTNGRIDGVVENLRDLHGLVQGVTGHVSDLHGFFDRAQNDTNAVQMNIKNVLTEVRSEVAAVRRSLDVAPALSTMQRQIDALTAEVAELKRRAS